jgi:hypothetical protein
MSLSLMPPEIAGFKTFGRMLCAGPWAVAFLSECFASFAKPVPSVQPLAFFLQPNADI